MRSNRTRATFAAAAALLALGGVPLACSDSEEADDSAAEQADDPNTDPGSGGDSAGVVAPIIIDGADSVSVSVGNALDVVSTGVTEVRTDNPEVLEVSQPNDDDSAQFNAGATVVGAGEATLEVLGEGGEKLYDVQVTAEG